VDAQDLASCTFELRIRDVAIHPLDDLAIDPSLDRP
jgi:hypothetical protein